MTQEEKQTAIPRLRFSEFRNAPAWISKELRSIADPISERAKENDANHILTLSAEHGLVLQSEYFGKQVAGTNAERYFKIRRNDFVYNDRTTKASEYGTIKRLTKYPHGIVSPIYKCFRFRNEESSSFWEFYFESAAHEWQLRKLANEGARAGRFNVTIERFLSTRVFSPETSSGEQKKVAECLSTLDELIEAESRKLDALKDHKTGLMQQLFPREGETRPRLRFPEFQDAPGWESKTVDDLVDTITPPKKLLTSDYRPAGQFPVIDQSQDYICGWTDDEEAVIDDDLPVVVFGDHTCALKFVDRPFAQGADGIKILKAKADVRDDFLFYSLQANPVQQESYKRHFSTLRERVVAFPDKDSGEQRRIAACVSSLDDLIAAQSERLEALRAHKRGLMQQLFPNPSEFES
jgi:type I restriction enzyme S subunit